jgi:hypothetical protein
MNLTFNLNLQIFTQDMTKISGLKFLLKAKALI